MIVLKLNKKRCPKIFKIIDHKWTLIFQVSSPEKALPVDMFWHHGTECGFC